MAHSLSAKKRIRQNANRRLRNRARKEALKIALRKFQTAIESGDAATIQAELRQAHKALDKASTTGILHRRNVDRKKSRLARAAAAQA